MKNVSLFQNSEYIDNTPLIYIVISFLILIFIIYLAKSIFDISTNLKYHKMQTALLAMIALKSGVTKEEVSDILNILEADSKKLSNENLKIKSILDI